MTRKHFIKLAAILKQAHITPEDDRHKIINHITHQIAGVCRETNPNFDMDKFLDASDYGKTFGRKSSDEPVKV